VQSSAAAHEREDALRYSPPERSGCAASGSEEITASSSGQSFATAARTVAFSPSFAIPQAERMMPVLRGREYSP
jgi:hypothetical protein